MGKNEIYHHKKKEHPKITMFCCKMTYVKGNITLQSLLKTLSHGAFFVATCYAILLLRHVKNILANCDGNMYLLILHLPRVELHCKLQDKLHRVTGP